MTVRQTLSRIIRARGKTAFLQALPHGARVLDVGCGNNSPAQFKSQRPDIWYAGLDVGDYNQTSPQLYADEYIIVEPDAFAARIGRFAASLDAVVSAHNLEHCFDPDGVLEAMLNVLKPGGRIYLAFPCEASVNFPRRRGTLNFYDDSTHKTVPDWDSITDRIHKQNMVIEFASQQYRPWPMRLVGLAVEPVSALRNQVMRGTWDLYGFESVIWASRPNA